MRHLLAGLSVLVAATVTIRAEDKKTNVPVLSYKMKTIDGKDVDLSKYRGKVVMFVNVASECGLTPQYKALQALHEKYGKDGLAIVGVPANEFGQQEPGSNTEIAQFCKKNYGVQFDMLAKVIVKGKGICPLYRHLTSKETSKFPGDIEWNFEKFLIGRNGEIAARFQSSVEPDSAEIIKAVEQELNRRNH